MRDRDDLEEQRWQPAGPAASRGSDPLAELARIVGQGAQLTPVAAEPRADRPAPQGAPGGQQDWINEIERAFAHAGNPAAAHSSAHPAAQAGAAAEPGIPAWLRSPAVPPLAVPEGQLDPRLHPEAFTQEFTQALDEAAVAARPDAGYYAQDPYQLAAGGADAFGQAHGDGVPGAAQAAAWPQAEPRSYAEQRPVADGYGTHGVYEELDDGYRADDEYGEEAYRDAGQDGRRRKLIVAAAVLGLGALAVAGVFALRGEGTVSGEPPVVTADSQPVKVEPETPGGAEVPNTNKAIYEHTNEQPTGEGAVVVDQREQPVDINQVIAQQNAAAQAQAVQQRAAATTTTETTTTTSGAAGVTLPEAPEPTSPAIVSLGEPKRVRTVSVRPDGSILPSNGPSSPAAPAPAAAPTIDQLASATPSVSSPATPAVPAPQEPAATDVQTPAVTPAARPVPRPSNSGATAAAPAANRPATRAPLQLGPMAIAPQAAGSRVAQAPAPAQPQASQAAGGAFTVQLAAPGSEGEARNLFATLQRRHGELSGYSPNIVRAQTGGRTIYRLRVGSFPSRDAATALCVRIQASGGQCFVARN